MKIRKKTKIKLYNRICKVIILVSMFYVVYAGVFETKSIVQILSEAGDKIVDAKDADKEELEEVLPTVKIEKDNEGIMVVISKENAVAVKTSGALSNAAKAKLKENKSLINTLKKGKKSSFLINNFFTVDATTSVTEEMMNPAKLLEYEVKVDEENKKKNIILIYHTHSSETYSDSVKGKRSDTVVGVGDYLTQLLEEKGYTVIHDTTAYDVKDGKWNRESYDTALPYLKNYIKENPGIIVTIDLHRNSGRQKVVTTINGENVAQIMLFNGVSRNKNGQRVGLENKNLQGNLAFSLRLLMCSMEKYPEFAKKTYIKGYRYNLHLVPRALLIEVGNDKNTVGEAKAAMVPFADILDEVLMGKYY